MLFAIAPDVFDRIEFGRVSRQILQLDPAPLPAHKLPDQPTAMDRQPIPNHRELASDVSLEVAQELDHLRGFDTSGKESKIKIPDRDTRHRRKTFPIERVLQDWSLAAWRPGPHSVGPFAQAAFVHKHYRPALLEGFFLARASAPASICGSRAHRPEWPGRPAGGPQPAAIAQRLRTCFQPPADLLPLVLAQAGFAPGPPDLLERFGPLPFPGLMPAADRLAVHVQSPGHFRLAEAAAKEPSGFKPPLLQLVKIAFDAFGVTHAQTLA